MKKIFKPKYVLILAIVGLIATILSIVCRLQIKTFLPDYFKHYNTLGYSMLLLVGTIGLFTLFFLLVKMRIWIKVISILFSWILVLFISTWLGHLLNDYFIKLYFSSHKESFQELILKAKQINICMIKNNFLNSSVKLIDCDNREIENSEISDLSKELGFERYRGKINVIVTYELSQWGSYGFYFSNDEKAKPKTLGFGGETKKWMLLDKNVYYFTYD